MTKIISAIVICAMVAHMIRPFGLPGLKKRGDVWKLALAAFVLIALVTAIRPE